MTTLDQDKKTKAVRNERVKLAATYLNGLAVAIFIVMGVAPMFATREKRLVDVFVDPALFNLVFSVFMSVGIKIAAQFLLKRIEP